MKRFVISALLLSAAVGAQGCSSDNSARREQPAAERSAPAGETAVPGTQQAAESATAEGSEAPAEFAVAFETTEGELIIDVHRDWSPNGADRFYELVKSGYFTDVAFFRVIDGFMAQGGIHGDPDVAARWRDKNIADDPVRQSNTRGMVSFAMAGPNTRTTQFFINLVDNTRLDGMGFSPFGKVRDMAPVQRLYSGYGEGAPSGAGPEQARIQREGNSYLEASFPELDYIRSARILD